MSGIKNLGKKVRISSVGGGVAATPYTDGLTVAVCNSVFENLRGSLLRKGVDESDIPVGDPVKLVDAVEALPTATFSGAVKKDYPICLLPNYNSAGINACYQQFVGENNRYYIVSDNNAKSHFIYDTEQMNFNTTVYLTSSGGIVCQITKSTIQTAIGDSITLNNDICIKHIPDTFDFVWLCYTNNNNYGGRVSVNSEDWTISSTLVEFTKTGTGSAVTSLSSRTIIATNGEKFLFANIIGSSVGVPYLFDLSAGEYYQGTWGWASGKNLGSTYISRTNKLGNYWLCSDITYGFFTYLCEFNWDNLDTSTIYTLPNLMGQSFCFFEDKIFAISFSSSSERGSCTLRIYDTNTHQALNRTFFNAINTVYLGGQTNGLQYNLHIEKTAENCYKLFSPYGCLVLDAEYNIINPIEGTEIAAIAPINNNKIYDTNHNLRWCSVYKRDDNYYLLASSGGNDLKTGLMPIYYNKVLFQARNHNDKIIFYPFQNTITKELLDGTDLDADTVSLTIDLGEVSPDEEA